MVEVRFDDEWFIGYRHHLLDTVPRAIEGRRPHAVHNVIHGARLGGAVERHIERELRRLPFRHASAIRAHMQFYRACLTATGLLPADALVNVAAQIEWFWYNTAFTAFYRDHLAHVMKVAAIGLFLLQDTESPLSDGHAPLVESTARGMARGSLGSPAIRAAARRWGNPPETLSDPDFWRAALIETIRLAGLLHDMAHPAVIASRMSRIAAPVLPLAPFERREREVCEHAVLAFGNRLPAVPFHRGELPDTKGLDPEDAEVCAEVFLHSHSLRAGYAITRIADEAGRVWQLSPFDAFVMDWAALAVSMHDYDKLHALRAPGGEGGEKLVRWLRVDANREAIRPCYELDPVSYLLAFSDRIQEFGRVRGPMDRHGDRSDRMETSVRYPCSAVKLRVARERWDEATVIVDLGPDDSTCFGATDEDYRCIKEHKDLEAVHVFGKDGWLDHRRLFSSVTVEVVREVQPPPPAEPVRLFYCFADEDARLRQALENQLASLKWARIISDWHRGRIEPGKELQREEASHLREADIVLVLVSPALMAQYDELERALRQKRGHGAGRVIPVLIRPVLLPDWLADLRPLPSDGKAVTVWPNQDEAWMDVAQGILRVVEQMRGAR